MTRPRSLFDDPRGLTREQAGALAKRVLSLSKASECRVTIGSGARGNTRFAVNQISTAGDNTDTTVNVRSVFGARAGNASTNKLDDAGIRAAVDTSERIARLSPDDPEYMPELEPQQYKDGTGWADATATLDPGGRATAVARITEASKAIWLYRCSA